MDIKPQEGVSNTSEQTLCKESDSEAVEPGTNTGHASSDQIIPSKPSSKAVLATKLDRRSPSPGVARRVVTDSSSHQIKDASVIDDLSKRMADSLLARRTEEPDDQKKKNSYMSINDRIKANAAASAHDKTDTIELGDTIKEGTPHIPSTNGVLVPTNVSTAAVSTSHSNSGNLTSSPITLDMLGNSSMDISFNTATLNMNKASSQSSQQVRTQTTWNISNESDTQSPEAQPSDNKKLHNELDILTAMSGEPTPNSLPNVCDGLSDNEVGESDSDGADEEDADDEDLMPCPPAKSRAGGVLSPLTNLASNKTEPARAAAVSEVSDHNLLGSDPFFKNHQTIMNRKSEGEKQEIEGILHDIRSTLTATDESLSGSNGQMQADHKAGSCQSVWEIRESYADMLRQQEQKRRQRMENERRTEEEYRERQQEEVDKILSSNKQPAAYKLDVEEEMRKETMDTEWSSDEDFMCEHDAEIGKGWSWASGNNRSYSSVGNNEPGGNNSSSRRRTGASHTQVSNASRLADHQQMTSPRAVRRQLSNSRDTRLSNSSLNSYSSSSQSSSAAPSTVLRYKAAATADGDISNDSDSSSSSSSSIDRGWNYIDRDILPPSPEKHSGTSYNSSVVDLDPKAETGKRDKRPAKSSKRREEGDYDTDEETDKLLNKNYNPESKVDLPAETHQLAKEAMKNKAKEVTVYDPDEPTVLIEGILFRAAYLGSTQLISDTHPSKAIRMMQAQEAVGRIKAPDGETQPSTDVDLFVSTEKVMVLNTSLKEIMMDHALRSISYIADIDNVLVVMAKRSLVTPSNEEIPSASNKQQRLICHVFETDEAHLIAQSIGQAFQVAYMEFLKANGIDDPNMHLKDTSYEDILEQQEIMNDELETFTSKDKNKEVVVPKTKGEILGIVIVESGWGSVLPTVVLANMSPTGPAARCGQLNIGDQIMSVNGISLVGLPLSTCQEHIKAMKGVTAVRFCVVTRPPVVEVLIRRPDKKYQLGFSVQNGVICSLLRGGIAERGGVRVGHRIIEINGQSVVAVTHEKIVYMLSTSVGEIHMKTMPMAIFRLLTGQEVPQYI